MKDGAAVKPLATPAAGNQKATQWEAPDISPAQVYLLAYNLACALGWNVAIQKIGGAFVEGGRIEDAVNDAVDIIVVLQLVSTLEFVHGCVGLVKSNPVNIFMQVFGRDFALFAVVTTFPEARSSPWVLLTFLAWAASEVIRYPFYALSIAGKCPPLLRWLRYSAFIVLYPLGFAGEFGTWIVGIPHIKAVGLPAIFPGFPQGSSIYLLYLYMAFTFGLGAPKLYMHMMRQRKRQLGPASGKVRPF